MFSRVSADVGHFLARFDAVGHAALPTVLLQGETGTGKGLVAPASSTRAARLLGMSRDGLRYSLQKFGLTPSSVHQSSPLVGEELGGGNPHGHSAPPP